MAIWVFFVSIYPDDTGFFSWHDPPKETEPINPQTNGAAWFCNFCKEFDSWRVQLFQTVVADYNLDCITP